jgi:hypothetical protein
MKWVPGILTVCTATIAWSASAQEAPTAFPPAMFPDSGAFGVVVHTPFRGDALKQVGVQWVRLGIRWRNVEQKERGHYVWEDTDRLLDYYLDNGFKVMGILTMERLCPLYEADKDNQGLVIDAIAKWAGAAAERYRGKGILWELSNEPEVFPMGGYWNVPKTYTAMARKTAAAVKEADPSAKVAAFSVGWFDRGFISESLDAGILADGTIDVLTYHGYHRRTMAPESGLAEDVAWLRGQIAQYAPAGKHIVLADSERGYAIIDFLEPKHWASWRNLTYSESAQAAYGARHFLETIHLGVEIAVWYKDMRGEECFSLYYGTEEDEAGLRPVGHVYRNLAALLPDNPKSMRNDRYTVSLTDPPDDISAPDGQVSVRTYLRSYLRQGKDTRQLIVALWYPVEAFDGKILDNRKRIGDHYYESWRATSPDDLVAIPTQVKVAGLDPADVVKAAWYDLLATSTDGAWQPVALEERDGILVAPETAVGPMPTILVVELK